MDNYIELLGRQSLPKFNSEQRTYLEARDFFIFDMGAGTTVAQLLEADFPFFCQVSGQDKIKSITGEVAFVPGLLFPESNRKTGEEHANMISQFNRRLQTEVPNLTAMVAKPVDYAVATYKYLLKTGTWLFENGIYVRALNRQNFKLDIVVGNCQDSMRGLCVEPISQETARPDVYIFPFIFPNRTVAPDYADNWFPSR